MARSTRQKVGKDKDWTTLDPWSADLAAEAMERFDKHLDWMDRTHWGRRIQRMWRLTYMRDRQGNADTTEIGSAGRSGETLIIQPNRLGRLVRDHLTLVQQTKSNPEPVAGNNDPASQEEVQVAKSIIEHYRREYDLEQVKVDRAHVAEMCGVSFLHVPWDPDLGRELLVAPKRPGDSEGDVEQAAEGGQEEANDNPEDVRIVYEGDYRFSVRTPYQVATDRSSPDQKRPRWVIVQEPENKWDLIQAVTEEIAEGKDRDRIIHAIKSAPSWSETQAKAEKSYEEQGDDEHDDAIAVYYVYGAKTRSNPHGLRARVIDKKTVLVGGPLGEPRIPVFRLSQGEVMFRRGEATTPNHDGLPLADALGHQLSTILSNNANHGMQRLIAPLEGGKLAQTNIDSGAGVIYYQQYDKKGNPLQPPQPFTPNAADPQLYQFYEGLAAELDMVVGGSSPAMRGETDATKGDSGSKVAALFAAAQNIGTSFVAKCLRSDEEVYTFLIQSLAIHATTPRMVQIVGKDNAYRLKEYTADSIKNIVRCTVSQADAMKDTLPGKLAMIELMKDKTPEQQRQAIAILDTGRVEAVTDPTEPARLLLERENEALRDPKADMPIVQAGDDHAEHWISHDRQLNNPDVRKDPKLVQRCELHKREHELKLMPTMEDGSANPKYAGDAALWITGQKQIPMAAAPEGDPNQRAGVQEPPNVNNQGGEPNGAPPPPGGAAPGGMPQQPHMPMNPTTGQRMAQAGQPAASPIGGPVG